MNRANQLLTLYDNAKGQRTTFESYWQSLHDYFYIEAQDVNRTYYAGTELTSDFLFDSTTLESADILASGFMNYLTPPTSKWFKLLPKSITLREDKEVAHYLEDVTDEVYYALDKSNFYNEMFSSYKSSGVYGTSCLLEEEDIETDIRFYSLPVKQVCIIEDGQGRIREYFIEFEYTATQAAEKWGEDKLSNDMKQELLTENRSATKKHRFLLYIAKRHVRDITSSSKENLPVEALWIDVKNKTILDEGGYNEFPAMCHRFDKRPFIPWGFSPAMKALPFARVLNMAAKTNLRAMMKQTDPPMALPNNAFIMPFNANPRAINYYNKTKMDSKDIFAFANYGNPQQGMAAVEYYSQQVKGLMYTDVFLAFDGLTKQMNNPEIMERINEKMTLLGPAVGRYISEMINPVIIRTIGILARRGKLPPPPDALMENPEYEIDSISQLAQAQRRSELNSLMTGLNLVGQMAQVSPEALDKISSDKVVDEAWSILGAPMQVLRTDDEIKAIREARNLQAEKQQAMVEAQQSGDLLKTGSEVDVNIKKSQEDK